MTTPSGFNDSGRGNAALDALAGGAIDADDVAILERVAGLFERLDPVPTPLLDRIRFGITLDALHAEVAQLQRADDLAGVRGEGTADDTTSARTVTFTSDSITTMITISPTSSERVRLDGWAAPGGGVVIELRTTAGTRTTTADADGRFVFADVPRGLVQLFVRPPADSGQPSVITPSIEI